MQEPPRMVASAAPQWWMSPGASGAEALVQVAQEKLLAEQRRGQCRLRKLNRELEHRNRELQDFVQVASHDLRSPLVNIRGFGDMLASACNRARTAVARTQDAEPLRAELLPLLEEEIPESLGYIRAGSSKMDALLTGLLNVSRIGSAALTIEQLDMNQMLAEIVASMGFSVEQAGATVRLDALPPCRGDATQLGQVFSNLLDNALKYLDPSRPGVIRVSATPAAQRGGLLRGRQWHRDRCGIPRHDFPALLSPPPGSTWRSRAGPDHRATIS